MNGAPASSALDKSLIAAYLAAHYRVDCDPPFVMRIGRGSAGLERLYEVFGVRAAAFVTACNPFGVPLGAAANREAQKALQQEVKAMRLICFPGAGEDPAGLWPGEESLLVLGLARDETIRLGMRHRQNAIVWAGPDAVPELVLLR